MPAWSQSEGRFLLCDHHEGAKRLARVLGTIPLASLASLASCPAHQLPCAVTESQLWIHAQQESPFRSSRNCGKPIAGQMAEAFRQDASLHHREKTACVGTKWSAARCVPRAVAQEAAAAAHARSRVRPAAAGIALGRSLSGDRSRRAAGQHFVQPHDAFFDDSPQQLQAFHLSYETRAEEALAVSRIPRRAARSLRSESLAPPCSAPPRTARIANRVCG